MNEGHTTSSAWTDITMGSVNKKQTFLRGKSTGLKNPTGKGKRLIIVYIDSDSGFVEGRAPCLMSRVTHRNTNRKHKLRNLHLNSGC